MGTRVLILSASIGSGHVKAAQAIERAILDLDQNVEVKHEDALDFINPALRRLCQNTYRDLAHNAPEILGLLYGHAERVWSTQEHGVALERWNSLPLIKVITKYNPDIVVSTHPQPADMISWLICKKRLSTQNAVVVTDFELNPLGLCQH